jgi:hypothetical protein
MNPTHGLLYPINSRPVVTVLGLVRTTDQLC